MAARELPNLGPQLELGEGNRTRARAPASASMVARTGPDSIRAASVGLGDERYIAGETTNEFFGFVMMSKDITLDKCVLCDGQLWMPHDI